MDTQYFKIKDDINESDHFKKMITLSVVIHVSLLLFFSIKTLLFPMEAMNLDTAIRVDMVDLPDKLQALPVKPDSANIPPVPVPVPVQKELPEPKVLPKVTAPKEIPKKPTLALPKSNEKDLALKRIEKFKKEQARQKMLQDIEKEVKQDEAKEKAARFEKVKAALVKGNALSPGTSLHGLNKAAFNDYTGEIYNLVQAHWNLPQWLKGASLKASVHVYVDHRGVVLQRIIEQSSGDKNFDDYALKAIDDAAPFPKPPEKFVELLRVDGIIFNMTPAKN